MVLTKMNVLAFVGIFLLTFFGFVVAKKKPPSIRELHGTSVVVLIDFSKSFAALRYPEGRLVYGFRNEDHLALKAVAGAIAEMAALHWSPPLKTVWAQIQSSSIAMKPLCPPLETLQKLIKPEGSVGTRVEIDSVLSMYTDKIVKLSRDESNLSSFTDISGAVAIASEIAPIDCNEKVIIIFSDFNEDIPIGTQIAEFKLHGERVILLHRPGTDEPQSVDRYLARIEEWKKKFLVRGAGSVVTLPVFAATRTRIQSALRPENINHGTNLTIMVDFKKHVSEALSSNDNEDSQLIRIGKALAESARDWQPPVTTLWVAIASSGFLSRTIPPIEFSPILIKKKSELNTVDDFKIAMEETAYAMLNLGRTTASSDISGTLALAGVIEPPAKSQILIIISDLVDGGLSTIAANFKLNRNTHVIMIHIASPADRTDPNQYPARRQMWEKRFRDCGAIKVSQFPLLTFTENDLRSCLSDGN